MIGGRNQGRKNDTNMYTGPDTMFYTETFSRQTDEVFKNWVFHMACQGCKLSKIKLFLNIWLHNKIINGNTLYHWIRLNWPGIVSWQRSQYQGRNIYFFIPNCYYSFKLSGFLWYTAQQLNLTPVQLLDVDSFPEVIHRILASRNDYISHYSAN